MVNYFYCCMKCKPPKRHPGCSSRCEEYKAEKARYAADKKKGDALRDKLRAVDSVLYRGQLRSLRERRGR